VVRTGAPSGPLLCDSLEARTVGSGGDETCGFDCFCLPLWFWVSMDPVLVLFGAAGRLDMLIDDDDRDAFHAPLPDWYTRGPGDSQRSLDGSFAVITGYWLIVSNLRD
jgi:hypothetical protein